MTASTLKVFEFVNANATHKGMAYRIVTKSPGIRIARNMREWLLTIEHGQDMGLVDVDQLAMFWLKEAHTELTDIGRLRVFLAEVVLHMRRRRNNCKPDLYTLDDLELIDRIEEFLK